MKHTHTILAALAAILMSGPALAADLPVKAPVQMAPAPIPNWTGFYLGLHGGYGEGHTSSDAPFTETGVTFTSLVDTPAPKGFIFGGQAGYNWQYQSVVGGLEIDFSGADINGSSSSTATINEVTFTATVDAKIDELASARARIGFLFVPNVLFYGTGGAAWAHSSADISFVTAGRTFAETANVNNFGWVAGGGLEAKVWDHLLARVEYLHYDFGKSTYNFPLDSIGTIFFSTNVKITTDVIRGGLSYKF